MKISKRKKLKHMGWVMVLLAFIISCALFGFKIESKDGYIHFQWGLYHYLKERR